MNFEVAIDHNKRKIGLYFTLHPYILHVKEQVQIRNQSFNCNKQLILLCEITISSDLQQEINRRAIINIVVHYLQDKSQCFDTLSILTANHSLLDVREKCYACKFKYMHSYFGKNYFYMRKMYQVQDFIQIFFITKKKGQNSVN